MEMKMFDLLDLFDPEELFRKPRCLRYFRHWGSGKSVSVCVSEKGAEQLVLRFERKIEDDDVIGGKLVPIALEEVVRRGGKRSTTIAISHESAEALQVMLKPALKSMRKNIRARRIRHRFMNLILSYIHQQSLMTQTR